MSRPARRAGPTSLLNFRVSAEERADLEARAARDGVSISAAVRQAVFGGEDGPAPERLTAGLGSTEDARLLEALAGRLGVLPGDLLRQLLEREHDAHDFVDARPGPSPVGHFHAKNYPRHVFTLHALPGRTEPLCVRRRVLEATDWIRFEFSRGRTASVDTDVLLGEGAATTSGGSCSVDTADDEWREMADGRVFFDLEPRFTVYQAAPTREERAAWMARRRREQALLRQVQRDGFVLLWRIGLGPTRVVASTTVTARPSYAARGWIVDRGDLVIGDGSDVRPQRPRVSLFDLAHGPACGRGKYTDTEELYTVEEPTPELLAELWTSPWAEQIRARREEAKRWRARQDFRRGGAVPTEALAVLGLDEWCTEIDVTRARKRAAIEHHPDRGGDLEAMKRANHAADVVLRWVRGRAA